MHLATSDVACKLWLKVVYFVHDNILLIVKYLLSIEVTSVFDHFIKPFS